MRRLEIYRHRSSRIKLPEAWCRIAEPLESLPLAFRSSRSSGTPIRLSSCTPTDYRLAGTCLLMRGWSRATLPLSVRLCFGTIAVSATTQASLWLRLPHDDDQRAQYRFA